MLALTSVVLVLAPLASGQLFVRDDAALPPQPFSNESDSDGLDFDNDGDVLVANSKIGPFSNELFRNTIDTLDAWAPTLAWTRVLVDAAAAPGGRTVHTSVFDNAPLYSTAWQRTWFELRVDGVGLGPIDAIRAGGQVFRAAPRSPARTVSPWRSPRGCVSNSTK